MRSSLSRLTAPSVFGVCLLLTLSCTSTPPQPDPQAPAPRATKPKPAPKPVAPPEPVAQEEPDPPAEDPGPCPEGMAYVEVDYCDKVKQTCTKRGEHDRSNHPPICAAYSEDRPCIGGTHTLRFCMDKYEFPNKKGAHPPVMVDAFDADVMCKAQGKRLCWSYEWTAACEGSKHEPYPYGGFERDPTKCRVDEPWIRPIPENMVNKDPKVVDAEMRKLDGSVPSGSMEGCKSDFGVYDLTGNFDEWVYIERPKEKVTWAALKGGWWGPLRNTCRPMTTSHPEEFIFYSVSFRCCMTPDADTMSAPPPEGWPAVWNPPKTPNEKRFGKPRKGWSPDYEEFKKYEKEHGHIRGEVMKEARRKAAEWKAKKERWEKNKKGD